MRCRCRTLPRLELLSFAHLLPQDEENNASNVRDPTPCIVEPIIVKDESWRYGSSGSHGETNHGSQGNSVGIRLSASVLNSLFLHWGTREMGQTESLHKKDDKSFDVVLYGEQRSINNLFVTRVCCQNTPPRQESTTPSKCPPADTAAINRERRQPLHRGRGKGHQCGERTC